MLTQVQQESSIVAFKKGGEGRWCWDIGWGTRKWVDNGHADLVVASSWRKLQCPGGGDMVAGVVLWKWGRQVRIEQRFVN